MKIAYVIPGFGGSYYCGNCAGSADMMQSFTGRDDQAVLVPMYMPFEADALTQPFHVPVFFGAVNVYLEEKFPLSKFMPRWLETAFNSETLLRWMEAKETLPPLFQHHAQPEQKKHHRRHSFNPEAQVQPPPEKPPL